jgi:polysaccharide biosynthesis protein PslG
LLAVALLTGISAASTDTAAQGKGDKTSVVTKKRARASRAKVRRCRRLIRVHQSRRRRSARSARLWRTARFRRCRRLLRAYDAERRAKRRRAAREERRQAQVERRAKKRACLARGGRWVRRRRNGRRARAASCSKPPASGEAPAPRSGGLRIGINAGTQGWGPDAGQQQDIVRSSGAGYLREELDWDLIEPQNDQWSWSRYDSLMTSAAQRGLTVLPLLMSVPGWAGASWDAVPSNPTEYSEYVAKVVARYGPGGDFWRAHPDLAAYAPDYFEIWNEPYLGVFAAGDTDPARYARLVKAATTAGRAANPNAKFLIEADTTGTDNFSTYHAWMDGMYAAVPNLGDYFDAVAVHPYGDASPDHYTPRSSRWQFRRIEEIKAKLQAHGDGGKHLWITEVGWTTCPSNPACASESQQAAYVSRMFEMVRTDYGSLVDAVFLYGFHDLNPGDPSDKEQWFGFIRRDGSFKPAWQALKRATGAA